jgi:hypothetical protein
MLVKHPKVQKQFDKEIGGERSDDTEQDGFGTPDVMMSRRGKCGTMGVSSLKSADRSIFSYNRLRM